ncbi:ABC transporter ATP-binding protein [Gordonia spumicola]|uniref:ABC transporter ATP-binding protein n=1 Tax=Gordonia spumicola TaxID=589161 RepID=A0A7I9V6H6_9ACTN|nr:ABC transporter ATP-binding protein [Gordonia spumicola]GEE01019.1 ABC transporter ATP-binding protein [Gordonia spumicola]
MTNTPAVSARGLTKRYGDTTVLKSVDFDIPTGTICGLFGRNGAGKTTLMSILTAQNFATSGEARIFGRSPYENTDVLSRLCFVRESQKYPEDARPFHAFAAAKLFFPNWNDELAHQLIDEFRLPCKTRIKKLSRGQLSAVGVIIGLASRAEVTFFDEPYLGLDAVARQIFYDRLLADYAEHPRTVVLSSHLIDEISDLIERVLVVDDGEIVLDENADDLRGRAFTVVGPERAVDTFIAGREELHRERLGSVASSTVLGSLDVDDLRRLGEANLTTAPVSLQELIVRFTQRADTSRTAQTREGALR